MIVLLASLAWGTTPSDEPLVRRYSEVSNGDLGGRIAYGALEGGLLGGLAGTVVGVGAEALMAQSWNWESSDQPGDQTVFVVLPICALAGLITGATVGGVIAANKVHQPRVAWKPIGPGGPGLTVVGTF